jgi:hypothetical protein
MVTPDLVSEEDIAKLIIPDDLPDEQPTFKAYIEAKVYDKEGHLIQYHRQPMRSLTEYFLALISILLIGTYQSSTNYYATGILTNVLGLPSQQSSSSSAIIYWDWSVQLGSGTQTFSLTLNSLAAPILNGTGSGELSYGSIGGSVTATSISVLLTVSNLSSVAVNVTEIGLFGTIYLNYNNSNGVNKYTFLLSYDTFSTAISIPASGTGAFQITLSFTG